MAKGTSGYMKNKKKTIKEMDQMSSGEQEKLEKANPIDKAVAQEQRADEESRGITDTIRNVFDAYWND